MSRFAGMAAALVLGVGIGATLWRSPSSTMTGAGVARLVADDGLDGFARQSAIAHVTYAPDIERPAQIGPARERELGEWVSHSLGTDVVPPVLTHVGYKLMGGRLLSGGDGPFAQFTYNDAKGERVTLCISHRKLNAQTSGFALYKDGPVKVFHWIAGAYGYSVTGGIDRDELLQVAQDVKFALIADGEDSTTGGENPTISN
jgi:anti-sigma factor RsiW